MSILHKFYLYPVPYLLNIFRFLQKNMPFPAFDMSEYNSPEFTRYAAAHKSPNGADDARPTALQIIKDEELGGTLYSNFNLSHTKLTGSTGKLTNEVILITGCSRPQSHRRAHLLHRTRPDRRRKSPRPHS